MKEVLKTICDEFNVSIFDVLTKNRSRNLADVRKAFAYIMLNHIPEYHSTVEIGKFLQRDHSSVIAANKVAFNLIKTDKRFRLKVETIAARVNIGFIDFNAIPQY